MASPARRIPLSSCVLTLLLMLLWAKAAGGEMPSAARARRMVFRLCVWSKADDAWLCCFPQQQDIYDLVLYMTLF